MFAAKVKGSSGQLREMYGSLEECVQFVEEERKKDENVSIQIKLLQQEGHYEPEDQQTSKQP